MARSEESQLRRAVMALAGTKRQRRYEGEIRERIAEFARARLAEGEPLGSIADSIDVSPAAIGRILGGRRLVPVAIVDSKPARKSGRKQRPPETKHVLTIRGPGGIEIDGLTIREVAELLRRLSCSD